MEDYVKKAMEEAAERKARAAKQREDDEKESARIQKYIDETKALIETGLKQWDGVLGFTFEKGPNNYWGYYKITKGEKVIVDVKVGWGSEERQYSDDCKVDHAGPKFELTFPQTDEWRWCNIQRREQRQMKNIEWVGNQPEDTADQCCKYVAEYMSKEYM